MKGLALRIVDGEIERIPDAPVRDLDWLQQQVGGNIGTALVSDMAGRDRIVVWCNDDYLRLGLPANVRRCTDGWLLQGTLIVMGDDPDGESRGLTPEEERRIRIRYDLREAAALGSRAPRPTLEII